MKIRLDDIQGTSRHHHRNHGHKHHSAGTGSHHTSNSPHQTRVQGETSPAIPVVPRSGSSDREPVDQDNQGDNRREDNPAVNERRKPIEPPIGQRNPVRNQEEDDEDDDDQMVNQINDSPGQESLLKSQNHILVAVGLGCLLVLVLVSATALITRKNNCRSPSFRNRAPNGVQVPPLPLVKPLPLIPMPGMTLDTLDNDPKSDNDQFTYSDNNVYCEPTTVMVPSSKMNGNSGHHHHHQVTRVDTSATSINNHHSNYTTGGGGSNQGMLPPPLYPPFITFNMIASHRDKSIPFIQTMGRRSGGQGGSNSHWSRPNVPNSPSGTMNPLSSLLDNNPMVDHHKQLLQQQHPGFQVPKFTSSHHNQAVASSSNSTSSGSSSSPISKSNNSSSSQSYSYSTGLPPQHSARDRFV